MSKKYIDIEDASWTHDARVYRGSPRYVVIRCQGAADPTAYVLSGHRTEEGAHRAAERARAAFRRDCPGGLGVYYRVAEREAIS